jgi:AraC-like DNA-binding protein
MGRRFGATSFTNVEGFRPLPTILEAAGGRSLERVYRAEGVPLNLAFSQNAWIPLRSLMGLMERSARETSDELFGFHLGELMRPEDFGVWARYALSASNLRGMIERAIRTLDYFESVSEFRLDISAELARWSYTIYEPVGFGHRHVADRALQPMLTALRYYLGPDWTPTVVECDYERPLHWRKLEELFGAPILFSCSTNALVFPSCLLSQPSMREPALADRITFADLRRMSLRLPPRTSVEAAREVIRARIAEPLDDLEGTAWLLGLSRRTLQRQLSEAGITYRDLLEQVRLERSLELLTDSSASITQIALAVGYSDVTSLSRAFRRRIGEPPSSVRRVPRWTKARQWAARVAQFPLGKG